MSCESPSFDVPNVVPTYHGQEFPPDKFQERFTYGGWYPPATDVGVLCVQRYEGRADDQRLWPSTEKTQYLRIAYIQELNDYGLEPIVNRLGFQIETLPLAKDPKWTTYTMTLAPAPVFCEGANYLAEALPHEEGPRMQFETAGNGKYSLSLMLKKLHEGVLLLSLDEIGTHDMLEHGIAGVLLCSELVAATRERAGYWLRVQPSDLITAEMIEQGQSTFLEYIERYLRTSWVHKLMRGDDEACYIWSEFLPSLSREQVRSYGEKSLRDLQKGAESMRLAAV